MNIVAIGGGEISLGETCRIDEYIVGLSGKARPRALFVPTASGDAEGYCDEFAHAYGEQLGCETDCLLLLGEDRDVQRFQDKIRTADIIYVGGGNTRGMMKAWNELGVGKQLAEALREGTILAGISAGAICWHQWGHSNSESFGSMEQWSYVRVDGLGLVPGTFCPHLDFERRHESFVDMMREYGGLGLACDNKAAIHYRHGETPRALSCEPAARVQVYRLEQGRVQKDTFSDGDALPLTAVNFV